MSAELDFLPVHIRTGYHHGWDRFQTFRVYFDPAEAKRTNNPEIKQVSRINWHLRPEDERWCRNVPLHRIREKYMSALRTNLFFALEDQAMLEEMENAVAED